MVMNYEEQTRYIDAEIDAVCQRLIGEGMDEDLIFATLLTLAAYGFANMPDAPPMAQVFRDTADELEAGEFTYPSDAAPHQGRGGGRDLKLPSSVHPRRRHAHNFYAGTEFQAESKKSRKTQTRPHFSSENPRVTKDQ